MRIPIGCHLSAAVFPAILIASSARNVDAQIQTPPGVVTSARGLDVNGKAGRRYPIATMTSATKARVQELLAVHHPDVLRGKSEIGEVMFVLGPKGQYVGSTVHPASNGNQAANVGPGVAFLPSEPRSVEYANFSAGEAGPKPLRVVVVHLSDSPIAR